MYIEFSFPQDLSEQVTIYLNSVLNRHLHDWSDRYNIPYNKKIHKRSVRITFDNEELYPFFAITWAPKAEYFSNFLLNYRFVEPMRRV